jgi:hypothetical protein
VLYGAATGFANSEYGAASGFYYIFCNGINDGLSFQVYALNLVSMVFGGGTECGCKIHAGMKPLAL